MRYAEVRARVGLAGWGLVGWVGVLTEGPGVVSGVYLAGHGGIVCDWAHSGCVR